MNLRSQLRISYFFLFVWFGIVIPHLQLLFAAMGFSPSAVGLILGAFQLSGVVGPLVLGHAADRWIGYRGMIAVTVAVSSLSLWIGSHVDALVPAMLCGAVAGFFFRGTIPLTDALANATLERPEADYGETRVFGSISFVLVNVGIQVTGLIDGSSARRILASILISGGLYALSLPFLPKHGGRPSGMPTEDTMDPVSYRHAASSPANKDTCGTPPESRTTTEDDTVFGLTQPVVAFLATVFLGRIGMAGYFSFFSIFLNQEVGVPVVGGYWALGAVAEIPVMIYASRLLRRFGSLRLVQAALFVMATRLALWSVLRNPAALAATQLLHAITFGAFHVASIAFVTRHSPRNRLGVALAVYSATALGIPQVVGSAVGGFVVEHLGFTAFYALFALLPLTSAVVLTKEMGRWKKKYE